MYKLNKNIQLKYPTGSNDYPFNPILSIYLTFTNHITNLFSKYSYRISLTKLIIGFNDKFSCYSNLTNT